MGMEVITDKIPFSTPEISATTIVSTITWVILFILFAIAAGIVTFIIMRQRKFNKRIEVYEKINGKWERTMVLRAMFMNIGDAGDQVLYVSKVKKFLPMPSIQTGRNTYWYVIREDKEWINVGLEDIDEKFREAGAWFLDKEARHARTALQKNLKDRFQKLTFLEKYGGLMVWTVLVLVIGVSVWLWFDKMIELSSSVDKVVKLAADVLEKSGNVVTKLDNVCTGSGIKAG